MPRGRPVGSRGGGGRGRGNVPAPPVMAPLQEDALLSKSSRIPIPVFDPENYHMWAFEMKAYMAAEGCFGPIDELTNGWAGADAEKKTSMRLQAFNLIRYSLGFAYRHIPAEKEVGDAKGLWDHIKTLYVKNDMETRLRLESRFQALYWDRTRHHVDSFLAELSMIRAEFKTAGFELSEEKAFTKLMLCLPEHFDIEKAQMKVWENPTIARAQPLLKDRENTLRERRNFESTQPLVEGTNFYAGEEVYSTSPTNTNTGSSKGRGHSQVRCHYCHRLGHLRYNCEKLKMRREKATGEGSSGSNESRGANGSRGTGQTPSRSRGRGGRRGQGGGRGQVSMLRYVEANQSVPENEKDEEDTQGFVFTSQGIPSHSSGKSECDEMGFCFMMGQRSAIGWILDTGATHHLCRDKECFRDWEDARVQLETSKAEAVLQVNTCGSVVMDPVNDGFQTFTLGRVLYSPNANSNLVALKPFIEAGCSVEINGDKMCVRRGSVTIVCGRADGRGLYVVESHTPRHFTGVCNGLSAMNKADTLRLLHNRLCHLHPDAIRTMIRERMAAGLPEDLELGDLPLHCPSCVAGKMTRQPYPKKNSEQSMDQSVTPLEVGDEVCSDTFGPINTPSRYGNLHVVEFIDKGSMFAFVFGIPTLDTVISKYTLVRNIFDTQLRTKIKVFRSDGHRCYDNSEFKTLLASDGTLHKIRSPYCPEQNAVAERRVRTIVEMARTMMLHACAPTYCWEDAVLHANHVRNRVATKSLKGVTPYQKFWKVKPDLQWLKPFGCLAYVLVHKERRTGKFEAAAMAGALMGVSDVHSGYKVHILETGSIKIARDVRCYEDIYPFRKSPVTELQWMNPMDCPKPAMTGEPVGTFVDPFVKMDQASVEAQRDALLIDLYQQKTPQTISDTTQPGKNTGRDSSDVEEQGQTSLVAEGVGALASDKIKDASFAFGDMSDQRPSIESLLEEGVLLNTAEMDPRTELDGPDREKWLEAFKIEYGAVAKTGTFVKITPEALKMLKEGKIKTHRTRPILTYKYNEAGEIARYKVRLVVKGYTMERGIDFDKTFSPCARMVTVRMVVALAVVFGWNVTHSDVPNAYLNGKTPHLVVIQLPFLWSEIVGEQIGKEGEPAIMANSLYGSPDAGRNWNDTYTNAFLEEGYLQCCKEPCMFIKGKFPSVAIFVIWVDDGFATGGDVEELERMHGRLKDKFNVKVLGKLSYALGIAFSWDKDGIKLTQSAFIDKIAQRFRMEGSNSLSLPLQKGFKPLKNMCPKDNVEKEEMKKIPYRSAVGSLLYVALCTRPDIAYAVCALARFSHNPGRAHWSGVKNVIKYLMHTRELGLAYKSPLRPLSISDIVPNGYSDSSFNDSDDGRSTLGYITFIHKYPIAWKSKVSGNVTQSSFESEWTAMNGLTREIAWTRDVFSSIVGSCSIPSVLRIDNRACVLCIDDRVTEANKHFRPKYFLVVQMAKARVIFVRQIGSVENVADMLTKSLGNPAFGSHRLSVGVM